MDLQRALWLRWSARWLIFTQAETSYLLYFFFSFCAHATLSMCDLRLLCCFQNTHRAASELCQPGWRVSPGPLCLSPGSTRCSFCLQRHTSRISRTGLNATWHGYSPETVYSLMQDTLGCLHRPQSNNTNHQPAWERGLLQRHAVPIEFSEVWRRVWRKRCEDWAEIRSFWSGMMCSAIWVLALVQELFWRPLWWSTGRVSVPNLTPLIFSTDEITSRKDSRLRFGPKPRSGQDDVNGPEQPTRAELKPVIQHTVTSEHQ